MDGFLATAFLQTTELHTPVFPAAYAAVESHFDQQ